MQHIHITANFEPSDELLERAMVPALLEYCRAVLAGDAGLSADERFDAENGVALQIDHFTSGLDHAD